MVSFELGREIEEDGYTGSLFMYVGLFPILP